MSTPFDEEVTTVDPIALEEQDTYAEYPVASPVLNPIADETSVVEKLPRARTSETLRAIGHHEDLSQSGLQEPKVVRRPRGRRAPQGSVGLRAAPLEKVSTDAARTREQLAAIRDSLQSKRDQHRQRVWDKLDEAKRVADKKSPRFMRFGVSRDHDDGEEL
ncbi:MAG: hypothetical protein R3C68_15885 [Myxococcota bacterium]